MASPSDPALLALREEVDQRSAELTQVHGERLRCGRGCADCCTDELTVFEVEAAPIRAFMQSNAALFASGPHPVGRCAFLDADLACRIYAQRPYVCRTQGLPLRWIEEDEGQAAEYRDICPLNEADEAQGARWPALHVLSPDDCFELGPFEARLATMQAGLQKVSPGAPLARVALRALFESDEPDI